MPALTLRPIRLPAEFNAVHRVINDSAQAYCGVIPADCWHEPYMSRSELEAEIADAVRFTVACRANELVAVMGVQDRDAVMLIRHAYVSTHARRSGIGSALLRHVCQLSDKPFLIGTWAAATWAIEFYCRHGFKVVSERDKDELLGRYWRVPTRQVKTSVVLADQRWSASAC